jgi:hypothetical protein
MQVALMIGPSAALATEGLLVWVALTRFGLRAAPARAVPAGADAAQVPPARKQAG